MTETATTVNEPGEAAAQLSIDEVGSLAASIVQNVEAVIAGKRDAVTASLTVEGTGDLPALMLAVRAVRALAD